MIGKRKSKRIYWEIMSQLEEAGEEDLCSLLNQVMGVQPYFGSSQDLTEYLEAVAALEGQGELRVRGYREEGERTVRDDGATIGTPERQAAFQFDTTDRIWKWKAAVRQLVQVPDS